MGFIQSSSIRDSLYSTNYVNNRHRLYEHFAKTTFKLDEKVKPLKFWKFALFGLFRSSLSSQIRHFAYFKGL
jgi:hypothetical protein